MVNVWDIVKFVKTKTIPVYEVGGVGIVLTLPDTALQILVPLFSENCMTI